MVHVVVVLLFGYFVSLTLAVLFTPSGDPYSIILNGFLLFTVLEASYWFGYVKGAKRRKRLGERQSEDGLPGRA